MNRMLLTATASSVLALAVPSVASATHNGKRHHGAHHASDRRHHAKHARIVTFTVASTPASSTGTPAATLTAPSTPSNETVGTVSSFTNGVLTITLTDGSTVSGKVTEETKLDCQPATPPASAGEDDQEAGDQSASEGGEHGGPSSSEQIAAGQQGDSQGGDGQQGGSDDNEQSCTTAALLAGAKVGEAELSLSSAGAVWEKVELIS